MIRRETICSFSKMIVAWSLVAAIGVGALVRCTTPLDATPPQIVAGTGGGTGSSVASSGSESSASGTASAGGLDGGLDAAQATGCPAFCPKPDPLEQACCSTPNDPCISQAPALFAGGCPDGQAFTVCDVHMGSNASGCFPICASDNDCITGKCGPDGACVQKPCAAQADCPKNYDCEPADGGAMLCTRRKCLSDTECDGYCVLYCSRFGDYQCDPTFPGFCTAYQGVCASCGS